MPGTNRRLIWSIVLGVCAIVLALGSSPAQALLDANSIQESTLVNVNQPWDRRIDKASARFSVLKEFNNAAVLDRETGLVWERSPGIEEPGTTSEWTTAIAECYTQGVGGRRGWRLPTVEELATLIDPRQTNPALPPGHPFTNITPALYWTATTRVDWETSAWSVDFGSGLVGNAVGKTEPLFAWCVRGR